MSVFELVEKQTYESPIIEITEFTLEDSIALSGNAAQGLFGFEEIWEAD